MAIAPEGQSSFAPRRQSALALQPDPLPPLPAVNVSPQPRQPTLFTPTDNARVVPIFGPPPERRTVVARRNVVRRSLLDNKQQHLVFEGVAHAARGESDLYTDSRVAIPAQRCVAFFVDAGVVTAGVVSLVGVYLLGGGELTLDAASLTSFAVLIIATALLYQLLWAIAEGDSPGLRLAQLRLIDFDGRRPRLRARVVRVMAGWLGALPAGLGYLWALTDEERLTWHDHISKTFPSPIVADILRPTAL